MVCFLLSLGSHTKHATVKKIKNKYYKRVGCDGVLEQRAHTLHKDVRRVEKNNNNNKCFTRVNTRGDIIGSSNVFVRLLRIYNETHEGGRDGTTQLFGGDYRGFFNAALRFSRSRYKQ